MLIKNVRILDEIMGIYDDSVDVCVDFEDGSTFTVSVATTKNLLSRMDQEKSNFSNPDDLVIVVRKLTQEIITEALRAYAEDNGFWLKLHMFASKIDISVFDELNDIQKSNLAAKIKKLAELLDLQ